MYAISLSLIIRTFSVTGCFLLENNIVFVAETNFVVKTLPKQG